MIQTYAPFLMNLDAGSTVKPELMKINTTFNAAVTELGRENKVRQGELWSL